MNVSCLPPNHGADSTTHFHARMPTNALVLQHEQTMNSSFDDLPPPPPPISLSPTPHDDQVHKHTPIQNIQVVN